MNRRSFLRLLFAAPVAVPAGAAAAKLAPAAADPLGDFLATCNAEKTGMWRRVRAASWSPRPYFQLKPCFELGAPDASVRLGGLADTFARRGDHPAHSDHDASDSGVAVSRVSELCAQGRELLDEQRLDLSDRVQRGVFVDRSESGGEVKETIGREAADHPFNRKSGLWIIFRHWRLARREPITLAPLEAAAA